MSSQQTRIQIGSDWKWDPFLLPWPMQVFSSLVSALVRNPCTHCRNAVSVTMLYILRKKRREYAHITVAAAAAPSARAKREAPGCGRAHRTLCSSCTAAIML